MKAKNKAKTKNVLYSVASILEYKNSIEKNLKNMFQEVDYIEDYLPPKNERTIKFRILRETSKFNMFLRKIYIRELKKYFNKIIIEKDYRYFIVIGGGEFSKEFIEVLREKNKRIKCIVFFWDKFETTPLRKSYMYFDKVFTFDISDSKEKNIEFLSTFYIEECKGNTIDYKERKIDLYYMGAYKNIERYKWIKKFKEYSDKNCLKSKLKLIDANTISKIKDLEIISYDKMNYIENIENLKNSRVVLDIPDGKQTGLTLRSFEALATDVKVITLNKNIYNYEFYKKENIIVVDSLDDIDNIPIEFFKNDYLKIEETIVEKYSTSSFLKKILGG